MDKAQPGVQLGVARRSAHIAKQTPKEAQGNRKKKKKRVRGAKPKLRKVLGPGESSDAKKIGRGRVRQLDMSPARGAEEALPRRLRALLGARDKIIRKQDDASVAMRVVNTGAPPKRPSGQRAELPRREGAEGNQSARTKSQPAKANVETVRSSGNKAKRTRDIVVQEMKAHSHQREKKRLFYEKRREKALARKERRKKRRRGRDSDGSGPDADYSSPSEDDTGSAPRFGEQAEAPPKLDFGFRRRK